MKKFTISIIVVLLAVTSVAQVKKTETASSDNTQNQESNEHAIYRLFPTQNMWTFIKLNTRNGQMWQVQYDVQGSDRFETALNLESLVIKEKEATGRFTLYSTQNIWTFILIDQLDGRTWQVQYTNLCISAPGSR